MREELADIIENTGVIEVEDCKRLLSLFGGMCCCSMVLDEFCESRVDVGLPVLEGQDGWRERCGGHGWSVQK